MPKESALPATSAIVYKSYDKQVERDDGEEGTESRRVLRPTRCSMPPGATTFQLYRPKPAAEPVELAGREERLDAIFSNVGAQLRHHGSEAYYEPIPDRITMPPPALFDGYDHYYAALAHELSHWTGHDLRLGRYLKNRFGSDSYAAEELVAELSAAILGADLGLPFAHLDHHANYIAH